MLLQNKRDLTRKPATIGREKDEKANDFVKTNISLLIPSHTKLIMSDACQYLHKSLTLTNIWLIIISGIVCSNDIN